MNEAVVQGVVHLVEETKTYGQKGFRKRLVVLKQEDGRFPNFIPVEFIQDGCDMADDINEGETIEVKYKLSGRKWQRDSNSEVKYFLSCEALSFKHVGSPDHGGGDHPPTMDETTRFMRMVISRSRAIGTSISVNEKMSGVGENLTKMAEVHGNRTHQPHVFHAAQRF